MLMDVVRDEDIERLKRETFRENPEFLKDKIFSNKKHIRSSRHL